MFNSDNSKGLLSIEQKAGLANNFSKSGVKTKKGDDQMGVKKDQSLLNEWRSELRRIISSEYHQKRKKEVLKSINSGGGDKNVRSHSLLPSASVNTLDLTPNEAQPPALKGLNEGKAAIGVPIPDSKNDINKTPQKDNHATVPGSAKSFKFLDCVHKMMASLRSESTELLADVRADRLDRDAESLQHITRLMEGKSSTPEEETRRDPGRGSNEKKGNGGDNNNGFNDKHEARNLSYSARARSVLDAKAVSLCQESIVLNPRDILRRCKALFLQAEQLFSIVTSFIELMTPAIETPGHSQNDPQDIQSAEEIKDCLSILVTATCTAVECVCTVLYVLPTPFSVSTKDWAVATSCFLDSRSAAVHVLTVCLAYNNAVKTLNRPHQHTVEKVEKEVVDQNNRQGRKGVLSLRLLESVLSDMEVIMAEEVRERRNINLQCVDNYCKTCRTANRKHVTITSPKGKPH